ncbi:MAG: tetratricopeptide repeat protein [Rhodoplanes sp.]|uniref:tetratricopeptide repeat protein n=1 Tax=Rhodoplanes sp. TaxID=1968906 RepID=UPI00180788C2|nr:tetratricopeptide repeat protein [Rhodoplanes sp.]NVO16774.1 tetratricopeptide repeat protein [Rhodoplanes sp.]
MRGIRAGLIAVLAGVAAGLAGIAHPALAADDRPVCWGRTTDPDSRIAACTRLLAGGSLRGQVLADTYAWRAQGWKQKAQLDRALADYDQAVRLAPADPDMLIGRGYVQLARNDNERARGDLDAALQHDPKKVRAWLGHGTAELGLGRFERAIADLTEAIRLDPTLSDAWNNRGYALLRNGQAERALADFEKTIALKPDAAPPYGNIGLIHYQKGDLDRALAAYDRALQLDPRNTGVLINRGAARRDKGDLDQALADYQAALALDPGMANAFFGRGQIFRIRGDLDAALTEFGRAVAIDPKYTDAYAQRGLVHEGRGDFSRAKIDYRAALDLPAKYLLSPRSQEMARARLALLADDRTPPQPGPSAPPDPGRRIALVVGNGAYAAASPLTNPANDARAVSARLRALGFAVAEGLDADRATLRTLIDGFLRDAATARLALLFYAGHGVQIDGRNYLIPVDAHLAAGADPTAEMILVDTILAGLDDQVRTNIVVLDACRDNPLAKTANTTATIDAGGRSVSVRAGLAAPAGLGAGVTVGAGTLIAFATAPGQVALDGDGDNSPFSASLVRHIGTAGIEIQQMLTRVRSDVVGATKGKQVPWSNSSLLGEVFLAGARP